MTSDVLCACGCGEIIEPFDKRGRPKTFIRGHHLRERYVQIISEYIVPENKKCGTCGDVKSINDFSKVSYTAKSTGETYSRYKSECKLCNKQYKTDHKEEITEQRKQYNLDHKEEAKQYSFNYQLDNKEKISNQRKEHYQENKEEIKERTKKHRLENTVYYKVYNTKYFKDRREKDTVFKLRGDISSFIRRSLKLNGSSKNGNSILDFLPYSMQELKEHLEKQFEPWMAWENHGNYDKKTWNDNDLTTWTWQLDHIIPQSNLSYASMADDNFQKCWTLSNLRPYSAKQNFLDGVRRVRH